MLNKIKKFILEENLINKKEPIIVAVSGGVDSLCLLSILHELHYDCILAHVNHHKREASLNEQEAMRNLADKLQIPFELLEYYDDGKKNFQGKAHEARYSFFQKIAKKYHTKTIATAHHLDDQAETIIMRLLSGSNLYGYAGIATKLKENSYHLVRPLLCVTKEEIYTYAQAKGLTFFEDASNQSDDYLRNRIRHHILPLLKEENPSYLLKLQEFSIQARESFDFIRKQSIKYLDKLNNSIEVSSFTPLENALKKDIVCLLFERNHIEKNYSTILNCVALIEQKKNASYELKDDYLFFLEYGKAYIKKKNFFKEYHSDLSLDTPIVVANQYRFYFSKKIPQNNAKYLKLCYNNLKLPFLVRNRKNGDFIKMSYGNKKIARLLIDAKVPKEQRDILPLVFDQTGNLLWVYDFAKSQDIIEQKQKGDIYLVCEEL